MFGNVLRFVRCMGISKLWAGFLFPALWFVQPVLALETELQVVRFPENEDIELNMLPTRRVPEASMRAKVDFEQGQVRIELNYRNMKPAVLFGGDVTCYVVWAVNRDGTAENLGELWVRPERSNDRVRFSTGQRSFALLVTAESYYQVDRPSEVVIFQNAASSNPRAPSSGVLFSSFAEPPAIGIPSLETVRYDGQKPLDVVQAERVLEIARRMDADQYAETLFNDASLRLEQATVMAQHSRSRGGAQDYARRSVASSNEAIRITVRRKEAEALEQQIIERRQQMQQLEQRAAQAEQEAAELARAKTEAEQAIASARTELDQIAAEKESMEIAMADLRQKQQSLLESMKSLEADRARIEREKARVEEEKEIIEDRLQGALSQVAETRDSARGFILSLPDILFDVDQATLKPEARVVLAKLTGILLILPELNVRIEGHTDSTGSASYNMRLSQQRADSVFDFLAEQGLSSQRMRAVGYGMERPIADNSTREGRQRNRRVEIVIAEGEIQEEAG